MPPPEASRTLYQQVQTYQLALLTIGRRLWRRILPGDIDGSWQRIAPQLVAYTAGAQLAAARSAAAYVPAVLEETGQPDEPDAAIRPEAFSGTAFDGRPLDTMLEGATRTAKARIGAGIEPAEALVGGQSWLESALRTAVADAARDATAAQVAVRGDMGWVRLVNPPCCSRCAVLAGKWYRFNDALPRHVNCFPAGVVVSGPGHRAATRRRYDGELAILTTASGQDLPLTGNHPVLTRRGWVPANLLREGDEVVRSTGEVHALVAGPDHHEMPARIEDVWRSLSVGGLTRVPVAAEDFHGDGQHGQVDVVRAHGPLGRRPCTAPPELEHEHPLGGGVAVADLLGAERAAVLVHLGHAAATNSVVRGGSLGLPFGFCHGRRADEARLARATAGDPGLHEALRYGAAADAVLAGQGEFTRAALVGVDDVVHWEVDLPRWDPPGGPLTVETGDGYARLGLDLLNRLAGQVELDRVVELRRVQWSGHVYSLTSVEGWHTANSLIVSNCDCQMIPSAENRADDFRTDPQALADRGLINDLTQGQRRRLDEGANLVKVLNESRDRWRERMAVERRRKRDEEKRLRREQQLWGDGKGVTPLPPGGVQDFMAHLTNRVHALEALRRNGIAE